MKINCAGLDLIKSFESCRLTAYQDTGGIWTIGYGHTGLDAHAGAVIDQATADILLSKDLERIEGGVERRLKVKVNEDQFSALIAFAFNVGLGNFGTSTLLKMVNSGDFTGAAGQFEKWNKVNGKVLAGLTRRRKAERALFES